MIPDPYTDDDDPITRLEEASPEVCTVGTGEDEGEDEEED